jgi:hypothetical protein
VTIDEIISAVRLVLGEDVQCAAADTNLDGTVAITDLISAVASVLSGCR